MGKQGNRGRAGAKWRALERAVLAEETHCGRCGQPVDLTLPRTHRWGATIGHIIEVDRQPELIYARSNVRLEHARCNYQAGARYGNKRRNRRPNINTQRQSRTW